MRQNGAMFICNRCRKQVFAERFDDGVFPYGWYECPVCGYRTDWEPHACPICHTLLEP